MSPITIKQVSWQQHEHELHALRHQVFVIEQQVPAHLEWEGDDDTAYHWLAYNEENVPVGCSRLLPSGAIGRMAILEEARGKNYGRQLLQAAIDFAETELGYHEVFLSAQTHARDFYRKSGFIEEGEIYEDAGIPHITMRKKILSNHRLGQHHGKFFISDHAAAVLSIAKQCTRQLRILNFTLDQLVFDNDELVNGISLLARKHRLSDIKILVADNSAIVKRGHKLLKLLQKLPSAIHIRLIEDDTGIKENVVIADSCGVIAQSIKNSESIWGDFNNVPVTQSYIDNFEILWGNANESADFRTLDI